MKKNVFLTLTALALLWLAPSASAQQWPTRPIRWVIPTTAGSSPDIIARRIAPNLAAKLGQAVIVENRPGAERNIAMQMVARSEPDGHTLLHAVTSLVTNPHLYKLAFDPIGDLVPVARIANTEWVLVVRSSLRAERAEDLVALARSNPGRMTCATTAGVPEIACRMLAQISGVEIVPVAYKGSPLALNDMLGDRVDLRFETASSAAPPAAQGRIRALATLNPRRGADAFGALPTMSESYPGFEFVTWQGILVRSGTPREIVARLSAELESALADQEVVRAIKATGNLPAYGAPQVFEELIRKDLARFGKLIRELGIRAEP